MEWHGWGLVFVLLAIGCAPPEPSPVVITLPISAVGDEAAVLRLQLHRFMQRHPDIVVEPLVTPDSADERHQLFVQWLSSGVGDPDVLQLDVVWTAEFAAAGWLHPLDVVDTSDFIEPAVEAATYADRLYAVPWFVDVGMLYFRTDLVAHAPTTLDEMTAMATKAMRDDEVTYGLVWQAARYEGLVTVWLEIAGAFGGGMLAPDGSIAVDRPPAIAALAWMDAAIHEQHIVPEESLSWREERARLAFQNGDALFMRNWPYAWRLMNDPARSAVAGRFGVAPMPAARGGEPTAALGGQELAVNAHSEHPEAARALVAFLTDEAQMLERLETTGQLPARGALYDDSRMATSAAIPPSDARAIIGRAIPRPALPNYSELSQALQAHSHRALSGQIDAEVALRAAAREMRALAKSYATPPTRASPAPWWAALAGLCAMAFAWGYAAWRRRRHAPPASERRLALALVAPAIGIIAAIGIFPLVSTVLMSLHAHDLRTPAYGRPFVGLANYRALLASERFWGALGHTAIFTVCTVALEMALGMVLALAMHRVLRWRGLVRAVVLLPWAIPTVVVALVWRFAFEGRGGLANQLLVGTGIFERPLAWFADATLAWVPLVLADVWKTTPFVALLLLAGLQTINRDLYEAARIDGAGAWARFHQVTLPLLRPAILVVLLFRTLDALRVFDLVYVLTGGGPGTATEPLALFTFSALLEHLRFGYGSAAAVLLFLVTFAIAAVYLRWWQRHLPEEPT